MTLEVEHVLCVSHDDLKSISCTGPQLIRSNTQTQQLYVPQRKQAKKLSFSTPTLMAVSMPLGWPLIKRALLIHTQRFSTLSLVEGEDSTPFNPDHISESCSSRNDKALPANVQDILDFLATVIATYLEVAC